MTELVLLNARGERGPQGESGFGYVSVIADTEGGVIDLAGANGGYAFVTKPFDADDGDMGFWILDGLPIGGHCRMIFDRLAAFYFDTGYDGANIVGHYEGVERHVDGNRMATLASRPKDVFEVVRQLDGLYRIWLSYDSYMSRIGWQAPGDSRNPEEAYTAIGTVGLWSDSKGIPYGDALFWHQGTVRKPIFGGLNLRGVGDTCPLFIEVFAAEDQDEGEGLQNPQYAVPWDTPYRIGSHISFRQRIVDGGGKLVICDLAPPGSEGGPGSLNQGISAGFDFFTYALPTMYSTPGGLTIRACRPDINCPIDIASAHPWGGMIFHGMAAIEGYGTFGQCITGGRLTDSNGQMWHSPALDVDRTGTIYGTAQFFSTPVELERARNFADISRRHFGAHGEGVDHGWRQDENMDWAFPVSGGVRLRGYGTRPGVSGMFIGGEAAQDWHNVQTARFQLAAGESQIINLRPGQFGWMILAEDDAHMGIFAVSAAGGAARMLMATAGGAFSNTHGTAASSNLDVTGGDARIQNNTGAIRNYYLTTYH